MTTSVHKNQGGVVTRERLHNAEVRTLATRVRRERIIHNLARLLVLFLVLGIWQALSQRYDVSLLPSPAETWEGFTRGRSIIFTASIDTATEIVLGFAIGAAAGVVLGALIGQFKIFEGIVHPYLILYQSIPKAGLAPMIVLIIGFGIMPKATLAAMSSFFPVLENTIIGIQRADADSVKLFRGLGANQWQTFLKLRLISALPSILTGLRVGVVLAVVSVVVAEFVAGRLGLGALMIVANAQLDSPLMFAALFALTLVGLMFYFTAALAEKLVLKWFNLTVPGD